MAYLITCAGSKKSPSEVNPNELDKLSFNNILGNARLQILQIAGIDLDWSKTLPAWDLYTGPHSTLYPKVSVTNWNKNETDVKILSALFGWIKHTDLIPKYDFKMDTKLIMNDAEISVWRFWCQTNLLEQLVDMNDVDLLSTIYRKAICGSSYPVAQQPIVNFAGYGHQKGEWLNDQLNLL